MVQNGVYAYARQHEGKTVFVMLNGTDAETTVPLKFYKEILKDSKQGKDILSGKTVAFGESLQWDQENHWLSNYKSYFNYNRRV